VPPVACLDDRDALGLVAGTLPAERLPAALGHVESCVDCRELIEGLCAGDEPPAPSDARIGSEHGAYAITALIAAGGMGRVYRATDRVRGREVALKLPRSRSPWLVRRFEREISITARLGHPGVVPLYDSGTLGDGTPFYVMRLVEGSALERAIQHAVNREQRLGLVDHLVAVATTMAFVHDRGIAHRDLKPHNVLVGAFGEVVILDWGLAKELGTASSARSAPRATPVDALAESPSVPPITGRTTRPGDVLGTPAFMAPEQARGEDVDQRADVYALGAMLEQLLVGFLPRKAADAALALAPAGLVAVCKRAMAPERDARHAHAGELATELRAALVTPATPPPVTSTWRRILGQS
jgi:serine/threonine protein kinase